MAIIDISLKDCDIPEKKVIDYEIQLIEEIKKANLNPPQNVILDGQIHRFASDPDDPRDLKGWYVAYSDGIPAGVFGDHSTKETHYWKADVGRELSLQETIEHRRAMQAAEEARARDRKIRQAERIKEAGALWDRAELAHSHPYLTKKQIAPGVARIGDDGTLLLPIYNADGSIQSLQRINNDGEKRFFGGAPFRGGYCVLGDWNTPVVYLVEGYATGSTVREKTGMTVVIAYSLNNLEPVYLSLKHKAQEWVLIADNDKSKAGQNEGERLKEKHGLKMVLPGVEGQDANDFVNDGGDLLAILPEIKPLTPIIDWLINADDFSQQPAPLQWLVKGWVQRDSLMMVHGPSGCGKTFIVLDWCMRIATDYDDWFGHKVRNGVVVYLAGEGHHGLRARVAAWQTQYGKKQTKMWLSSSGCDFNSDEGYQLIVSEIEKKGIKPLLIVVDTLHRFMDGNENDSKDVRGMLSYCARLQQRFNASVLLVHHTGVSAEAQDRARGSSAWRAALDIEVSISPAKEETPIKISQRKSKDAELARPINVMLSKVEIPGWIDEDGEAVTSAVVTLADADTMQSDKSKGGKSRKWFEDAWYDSERLIQQGSPYLSRSDFLSYLIDSAALTPDSAKKYLTPTGKIVKELIDSETIAVHSAGWIVIDDDLASVMMLLSGDGTNGK